MRYLFTLYYLSDCLNKHNKIVKRWKKHTSYMFTDKKQALSWVESFSDYPDRKVSLRRLKGVL